MAAPSGKYKGVGFRHSTVFALQASGWPAATATTVYEGTVLEGSRVLTLNMPEPRNIPVIGDDRLYQVDVLPPLEGVTGELQVAREDFALQAVVSTRKVVTLGEAKLMAEGVTDVSGSEPQVGLMAYRQALDEAGARVWESYILPRVVLTPRLVGFTAEDSPVTFTVTPQLVTKHLWGVALATATEGVTQAQAIRLVTGYKPYLVAWLGNATLTKFLFATARQAVSTAKVAAVWVNGAIDATAAKAVDGVTPTAVPGVTDIVVCLYEVA